MWKSILLILIAVALGVLGQVNLKQGMTEVNTVLSRQYPNLSSTINNGSQIERISKKIFKLLWHAFLTWKIIIGIFFYALSMIVWLLILSRVDLSFAYPMLGLSYVLVVLSSWLILGENISPVRWAGTIIICIGVALVAKS